MKEGNNSDDEKETGNDLEVDKTQKTWRSGVNKHGKKTGKFFKFVQNKFHLNYSHLKLFCYRIACRWCKCEVD